MFQRYPQRVWSARSHLPTHCKIFRKLFGTINTAKNITIPKASVKQLDFSLDFCYTFVLYCVEAKRQDISQYNLFSFPTLSFAFTKDFSPLATKTSKTIQRPQNFMLKWSAIEVKQFYLKLYQSMNVYFMKVIESEGWKGQF